MGRGRKKLSISLLLLSILFVLLLLQSFRKSNGDDFVILETEATLETYKSKENVSCAVEQYKNTEKSPKLYLTSEENRLFGSMPLHILSREEPYASRINGIRSRCEKQGAANSTVDLSRMFYDDRHKVVMCVVPKAACTTMKEIMWFLMRKVRTLDDLKGMDRNILTLSMGNLYTLDNLDREEAIRRLVTYTTVFVKRHPLQRILSAYKNKFTKRAYNNVYKLREGRKIALNQAQDYMHSVEFNRTGLTNVSFVEKDQAFKALPASKQKEVLQYVNILNSGEIGFDQLARNAAEGNNKNPKNMDVHWRPQVLLCNPCALNYDYVIDFDDLGRDSNRLLDFLQRDVPDEPRSRLQQRNSTVNRQNSDEAFSDLGEEIVAGLKKLYQSDFYILGYE